MPTDTRTGTVATVGPRETPATTRHHTGPFRVDHLTAVVAIGALLWVLGTALVISWRDSGTRLQGILREFDDPGASRTADRR